MAAAFWAQKSRGVFLSGLICLGAVMVLSACTSFRSAPVCLSGAKLDARGRCVAQQARPHHIPFRQGVEVKVTQGFHGYVSHREDLAFAVDFACEEGTPITASRSGVVWAVRKDSNHGCPDAECVDDANYVILDHGDGTYSSYFHLQFKGVVVEPGQQICQGQLIGLCGNTGFSSGPHLHFAVMNTQWLTIPVAFREAPRTAGVVLPRNIYRSENQRRSTCRETDYSRIERDGFAHRGIILNRSLPTVFEHNGDKIQVRGVYNGNLSHVAIHRRRVGSNIWYEQCVEVDGRGRFAFDLDWPAEHFTPGQFFLMLTGSDEDCSAPGWAWSYRVRVDAP